MCDIYERMCILVYQKKFEQIINLYFPMMTIVYKILKMVYIAQHSAIFYARLSSWCQDVIYYVN